MWTEAQVNRGGTVAVIRQVETPVSFVSQEGFLYISMRLNRNYHLIG